MTTRIQQNKKIRYFILFVANIKRWKKRDKTATDSEADEIVIFS